MVKDMRQKQSHDGIDPHIGLQVDQQSGVESIGLVAPDRYDCDSLELLTVICYVVTPYDVTSAPPRYYASQQTGGPCQV